MQPRNAFLGWDDCATAFEATLTLMMLAILIIGIVEFSFGYWVLNSMQLAVAEGGRYALSHRLVQTGINAGACQNPNTANAVVTVVENALPMATGAGQPFSTPSVSCSPSGCCPSTATSPATITISVGYQNPVFNLLSGMTGYSLPVFGATNTVPLI